MAKEDNDKESLRGKIITVSYPDFIVDEMTRKLTFEREDKGMNIKVTRKKSGECSWMEDDTVLKTYLDVVGFICRFASHEMPRHTQYMLWCNRIEETIDILQDMIEQYGRTGDGYKPGLFINGESRTLDNNLKELLDECWK